jgi:two-component system chemotaxis sensor kinase CheA
VSEPQVPAAAPRPAERLSVLLVEGRHGGRMAIPLSQVARLEEFPRSRIERVADRRVVQYGGRILPLLDVDVALGAGPEPAGRRGAELPDGREAFQVVVYNRPDRSVGLCVERILDIVEQDSDVRGPASRLGVACTAVIHGHVTELLDVEALLQGSGIL